LGEKINWRFCFEFIQSKRKFFHTNLIRNSSEFFYFQPGFFSRFVVIYVIEGQANAWLNLYPENPKMEKEERA
jgi:hypothetical protein